MMKDSSPAASIQVAIFDLFKIISDRLKRVMGLINKVDMVCLSPVGYGV